jgi:hypothetical protein
MGYHEIKVGVSGCLTISPDCTSTSFDDLEFLGTGVGEPFDLDYFGMDDGAEDNGQLSFRFLFRLGKGLFIYLYGLFTCQTKTAGAPRYGHRLWIKDCCAAYIDETDLGTPDSIIADKVQFSCPYEKAVIRPPSETGEVQRFDIEGMRFTANPGPPQHILIKILLMGKNPGESLNWDNEHGWRLDLGEGPYDLAIGSKVTFEGAKASIII